MAKVMSTSSNSNNNDDSICCFKEWMNLQEQDLSELLQALHISDEAGDDDDHDDDNRRRHHHNTSNDDQQLHQLIQKSIQHFQDYIHKRSCLARQNVSTYFAPRWCTPLECSIMWIGGCRPTIFVRLLYALIGEQIESQMEQFLQGGRTGHLGDTSPMQINLINILHRKTIREEDKLSARLASLQEDMADNPISIIAKQARTVHCQPGKELDEALDKHARSMRSVMEEADNLRLSSLKELISILTPVQGANFLAASKKLHLCIHEWSGERGSSTPDDRQNTSGGEPEQGRNPSTN